MDYERKIKTADNHYGNPMLKYEDRLMSLQATFVGEVAAKAHEYIEATNRALANQAPWDSVPGFISWDYGAPKQVGPNTWKHRVYQKSASQYPDPDFDPNILITIEFERDGKVSYDAESGNASLASGSRQASSSSIATEIGYAWKETLKGML